MKKTKVLFILKRRQDYNAEKHSANGLSTGLFNSASFMVDMLNDNGIEAHLEIAIDNNCIDRLVTKHRPTHVIIEAIWVVPTKFIILSKLHPSVKWIIRVHSEMPFLASEGKALDWIAEYSVFPNIDLAINAPRMLHEIRDYIRMKHQWTHEGTNRKIFYLPNYYPQEYRKKEYSINKEHVDIGCFGAIRPLKNHMLQACAALKFAEHIGKKLHFHINVGRIEMNGGPVLDNLRAMFMQLHDHGHRLIHNEWTPREEFLELCHRMDIGLQVSFSETFNIVGADIVSQGVPLVGSIEIPWFDEVYAARAQYSEEIYKALLLTHHWPQHNVAANQRKLTEYTDHTLQIWLQHFMREEHHV